MTVFEIPIERRHRRFPFDRIGCAWIITPWDE